MIGLTALLTIGSGVGQVAGGVMSAIQNRRIAQKLAQRKSELQNWFDTEYNKSFLETEESKSALKTITEQSKKNRKYAEGRKAVMGGTDEAQVAAMARDAENYAAAVNQILGLSTGRKENMRREYVGRKENIENQEMALDQARQQSWQNFMSNAAQLGSTGAMLKGMGADMPLGNLFATSLKGGSGGMSGWDPRNMNLPFYSGSNPGMYSNRQ